MYRRARRGLKHRRRGIACRSCLNPSSAGISRIPLFTSPEATTTELHCHDDQPDQVLHLQTRLRTHPQREKLLLLEGRIMNHFIMDDSDQIVLGNEEASAVNTTAQVRDFRKRSNLVVIRAQHPFLPQSSWASRSSPSWASRSSPSLGSPTRTIRLLGYRISTHCHPLPFQYRRDEARYPSIRPHRHTVGYLPGVGRNRGRNHGTLPDHAHSRVASMVDIIRNWPIGEQTLAPVSTILSNTKPLELPATLRLTPI
jgi:hypothetical protein